MKHCSPFAAIIALMTVPLTLSHADDAPSRNGRPRDDVAAKALFRDRVQPLLARKCLGCHGANNKTEGELDLRSEAGLKKGGESGAVVVPGDPESSPLFVAVLRTSDVVMPPKDRNKLNDDEIETLRNWIESGASWHQASADDHTDASESQTEVAVSTSGGLADVWTNRKYKLEDIWAYRPIQRPAVPWSTLKTSGADLRNPIDAFIARQLTTHELHAADKSDRRTLIRRVTLDLTGLAPTAAEIATFEKDESPQAYRKLVDRLLASDAYGEQQARHWLDVARYSDTAGFSNDFERPNAWRYRDYVVRSFNADKPFDRFIVEQIAGDELDPADPELLIAVGFLRMGPWEHTGMSVASVTRQQFLDDVTNSVGVTFLGQGLRCAKCHDHKFDPIPTRDYYRIQAAFAPVQFADRDVAYLPSENTSHFEERKARTSKLLKEAQAYVATINKKTQAAVKEYLAERDVKSFNDLPTGERPNRSTLGLTKIELSLRKIANKRVGYFQREMKRYRSFAFSVYDGPPNGIRSNQAVFEMPAREKRRGKPHDVFILTGGSVEVPGEMVSPGVLTAVYNANDTAQRTAWNTLPTEMHGRRLALANWIASPQNTLTPRVIVNRIWQQHFAGNGIVRTPNNFGKMGAKPTHPEMLDWMATWFIEHGWSIKRLHRMIVTSDVYRQSGTPTSPDDVATIDPNNKWLSYYPPRRLTAEELRDTMLQATGELNREMGGPGIYPEMNWEVAFQPRHIMGSVAPAYQPSPQPAQRNRRTIYAFQIRTLRDPLLEVFNKPGSDVSCERRDETTVTPQVFSLFNGEFAHNRAVALTNRIVKSADDDEQRVQRVYQELFGRLPSADESAACLQHVAEMTQYHERHPVKKVELPTSVKRSMVEEQTGEDFSWDEELDVLANYTPDLKPWDVDAQTRAWAEVCLVLLNSNEFIYVY